MKQIPIVSAYTSPAWTGQNTTGNATLDKRIFEKVKSVGVETFDIKTGDRAIVLDMLIGASLGTWHYIVWVGLHGEKPIICRLTLYPDDAL